MSVSHQSLLPAISLFFLLLALSTTLIPQINAQASSSVNGHQDNDSLVLELREAKLKIDRLESILEESILDLNSKSLHLIQNEKLIKEMTRQISHLQSTLLSLKDNSSRTNERLNELEEEVQRLWAASRKNNFEIHSLESKAHVAEKKLEKTTSRVDKMTDIVNEQWIQIQQLEQALQIAEKTAKREANMTKCSFIKFFRKYCYRHLQSWRESLGVILAGGKRYHHQLQAYITREITRGGYHYAAVVNEEVVFILASALVVFPIFGLGMFLLSIFG